MLKAKFCDGLQLRITLGTIQKSSRNKIPRHYSFSTYAKSSEKPTFRIPDTHTYVYVSGGMK